MAPALPLLLGAGALLVIWFIVGLLSTEFDPLKWAYGADGRVSTSKLQLLMWTAVVLFSFLVVLAVGIRRGSSDLVPNIPPNVLIALGFTGLTAVTAKGITMAKLQRQDLTKVPPSAQLAQGANATARGLFGALQADDGTADLSKIQMLVWTLVALGIYLYRLVIGVQSSASGLPALPDIDPALMVLTGLSQGTYLGKKLVTTSTPQVFFVVPREAAPGDQVTLKGASLGASQDGNMLILGNVPVDTDSWSDGAIIFTVPDQDPNAGQPWVDRTPVSVRVISSGRDSVGSVNLIVRVGKAAAAPAEPIPSTGEPSRTEQPVTSGTNGEGRTADGPA